MAFTPQIWRSGTTLDIGLPSSALTPALHYEAAAIWYTDGSKKPNGDGIEAIGASICCARCNISLELAQNKPSRDWLHEHDHDNPREGRARLAASAMSASCEHLVTGSYDRFLFGFQCSTSGSDEAPALKRKFAYPAHKGPVKCIAAAAPIVASGGGDDLIHLYNLEVGSDLGFIINPSEGAVSAVAFFSHPGFPPSHLLSGSADGSLSIWQAEEDWTCLKALKGHRREVTSISLHPSGRLALSAARDSTIKLWNLVRGKCAHTAAVATIPEQAAFSPSGAAYALVQAQQVQLQDIDSSEAKARFDHPRRVQCLAFGSDNILLTGSEDGTMHIWDARAGSKPVSSLPGAHGARIRAVAAFGGVSEQPGFAASASTDGLLKVWDCRQLASMRPVAEAATKARLTCLATLCLDSVTSKPAAPAKVTADKNAVVPALLRKPSIKSSPQKAQDGKQQKKGRAHGVAFVASNRGGNGKAHEGLVDFMETPPTAGQKQKRKQHVSGFMPSSLRGEAHGTPSKKLAVKSKRKRKA